MVVVDIDDDSIEQLGSWPWPRSRIVDLVEVLLTDYQARAVGLDIVFPEPRDSEGDLRLTALAKYAPISLAQVFDFTPRYPNLNLGDLPPSTVTTPSDTGIRAFGYVANHSALSRARCIGNIGYQPDQDGVLRRTPLLVNYAGQSYPQFAVTLLDCATSSQKPMTLPLSRKNGEPWRIPFRHALDAYTVLPAIAVLRQEVPPELVHGRFAVVGSSSLGLGDRVSIPLAPLVSGVMVHAQSISALLDLQEGKIRAPWDGRPWLTLWTVVSMTLGVLLMVRLSAWRGLLLLLGLTVVWLLLASWGFYHQADGLILAPMTGYFLLLVTIIPHEWRQTQKHNRKVLETLSHYVSKPVLEELARRGEIYSLTPALREVTVLIADIEGYTRLTSALPLETTAKLTRDFLDCLTRPMLHNGGTLDKYSGDGMVALWGAPLDCPDHADRAVETALQILAEVKKLNLQQACQNLPAVRVRIGIESGTALVGDFGTPSRSTYTAVGDCINFASRLESAAKNLPFPLLIGSEANARLKRHITSSAGEIQLRDTNTVIQIYTMPQVAEDVTRNSAWPPVEFVPSQAAAAEE